MELFQQDIDHQDFQASRWLNNGNELASLMAKVRCEGGQTQIARLLRHSMKEHRSHAIQAAVFIGDAVEESPDLLCELAGQSGLLQLPLFLFHEGRDKQVEQTFRSMAKLSGGAYARFDSSSASVLAGLLGAVASFAKGGRAALEQRKDDSAKSLADIEDHLTLFGPAYETEKSEAAFTVLRNAGITIGENPGQ